MSVIRVEKTRDYTVMSNHHLRNRKLSLKAKGLMSLMLSLPDDWDYTIRGLATISKDGVDAVRTALGELESSGYVTRQQTRDAIGRLSGCDYTVREVPEEAWMRRKQMPATAEEIEAEQRLFGNSPLSENPTTETPSSEPPSTEEATQSNTYQLSKEGVITHKSRTKRENAPRHRHGTHENVLLTDAEFEKLREKFPTKWGSLIDHLSWYLATHQKQYKDHYLTILNWERMDSKAADKQTGPDYSYAEADVL